ncbi:MAG: hypothetical protein ACRCZ4_07550 [Plesiomonas sp.]|uniref:hypothetical protein n=1 Tax=Plesiomonas sp. TaxID=2486279 RepID=UPI003F2FDC6E
MNIEKTLLEMYAQINRQQAYLTSTNKEFMQLMNEVKQLEVLAEKPDGDIARDRLQHLQQQFPHGLTEHSQILADKVKKIKENIKQMEALLLTLTVN